jgi:micrococcal nuclease
VKINKRFFGLMILAASLVGLSIIAYKNEDSSKPSNAQNEFLVTKVVDGDTIEIDRFGRKEKVRLIGIDTPETLDPRKPVQCFGKEASQNTKGLLEGKRVRVESDPTVGERDKYNRLLGYVWVGQDRLINQELIKQGFAHEYTYRSQAYKYQKEFKNAEVYARQGGLGFWSAQTCNGNTK